MSIRKGYSDSKLNQTLKPKFEDENLGNFLPNFLLKDMKEDPNPKGEREMFDPEKEKYRMIFDSTEEEDLSEYLNYMSMKEVSSDLFKILIF